MRRRVMVGVVAAALCGACDDGGDGGTGQLAMDAGGGADGGGPGPADAAPDQAQAGPDGGLDASAPMDAEPPGPDDGPAPEDGGASPDGGGGGAGEVLPCVFTVVVGGVEVFAYEASRPDATADASGEAADSVCSRAGVLPWARVTQPEARAACEAIGFHLCTDAEWAGVCQGDRGWGFPYGQAHRGGICNDHVTGSAMVEPTGSRADCVTPEGVFDLSGNVWEMSDGESRWGASYLLNASFREAYYAGCGGDVFHIAGTPFPDVGFRCCR